ncbi:MMPL family transporter [Antrihabitans sp. YC2-6]|uniref:MMPL family transporter n=1 Tax=Antrihabitans sp. YC2-6 TaxID=2799498 RepID=UPI0018F50201|nr:MMPL family transporter [Antrihabitans sp. YC2-6]MBJ8343348.1 MMPL family transporter [Antrihabitans sp. YC2-6]
MARRLLAWPAGRKSKWIVLVLWIILLAVSAPLAGKLSEVQKNDLSAWLPGDAESAKAFDAAKEFGTSDALPAIVVYDREGGALDTDFVKATADAAAFTNVEGVVGDVVGPQRSKDGKSIQTIVNISLGDAGWQSVAETYDGMKVITEENSNGLNAYVTGPGGYAADSGAMFSSTSGILGILTALVVLVILLLTYRSPVLWFLPLVTVIGAVSVAEAIIYALAKYADLTVNIQSAFILIVLVFGASTDYALLLVARYREELRRHEDHHEAMAEALHRSGPAIIASASTVGISLLLLALANLNSTSGLGPVCAVGIFVGLLAMITLMPALLVICGRRVFWPRRPEFGSEQPADGIWDRVGRAIAIRPRTIWIATVAILALLSVGILGLKAEGVPNQQQFTTVTQSVEGERIHTEHFDPGVGDPAYVISSAENATIVRSVVDRVPGVVHTDAAQIKDGTAFTLVQLSGAPNSDEAMAAIGAIRDAVHLAAGDETLVGGGSALTLDMQDAAARDTRTIIPIVLLVVLVILGLLLRAIVAPILLVATVIVSFGAALGISSLVFNHIFHFGGADPALPLWTFVFLVALGVDYNIFLVTRVREETPKYGTRVAALRGLSSTGGVITSAGLVLAGTFAVLGSIQIVFVAEMGFAVALGVLIDTFIVRSVVVTALTLDVGKKMWWPSKLESPAAEHPIEPDLAVAEK